MSGYSCRSGVICHSSELHQPRQRDERRYILIRGRGKLGPACHCSYSAMYTSKPPKPAAPSSGALSSLPPSDTDLISDYFILFYHQILLDYVFLQLLAALFKQWCFPPLLILSWLSSFQYVMCYLIASDLGPVADGFWGGGACQGYRHPVFLPPSVCVSVSTPLRSHLCDRCQEPHAGSVHSSSAHS